MLCARLAGTVRAGRNWLTIPNLDAFPLHSTDSEARLAIFRRIKNSVPRLIPTACPTGPPSPLLRTIGYKLVWRFLFRRSVVRHSERIVDCGYRHLLKKKKKTNEHIVARVAEITNILEWVKKLLVRLFYRYFGESMPKLLGDNKICVIFLICKHSRQLSARVLLWSARMRGRARADAHAYSCVPDTFPADELGLTTVATGRFSIDRTKNQIEISWHDSMDNMYLTNRSP